MDLKIICLIKEKINHMELAIKGDYKGLFDEKDITELKIGIRAYEQLIEDIKGLY